jgi:phage tail protein X
MKYITKEGDRWDLLAWKFYGDPYMYEPLLLENKELMRFTVLPAGKVIEIPEIIDETTPEVVAPPWQTD